MTRKPKREKIMNEQTEIQNAMARAFFAYAWADAEEEAGQAQGGEIMDRMPCDVDPAAAQAARALIIGMESMNGCTMAEIYDKAETIWVDSGLAGDRDFTPENFGHYCAMQAMGHGVGLSDAFGGEVCKKTIVPYVEFGSHSLERDYFTSGE